MLAAGDGPTIVCAQAGDVNTGAFDPLAEIVDARSRRGRLGPRRRRLRPVGRRQPRRRHLLDGYAGADSWATDGHKWLNVPHDCGLAFVADPEPHRNAMIVSAAYLRGTREGERDGSRWVPDFSRRGRGFAVYAALRSLGREGVAEMVERCCACARRFAEVLGADDAIEILNDVVLNQVLVRFADDDATTDAVVAAVQAEGTLLDEPDDMARPARDAHLGVQLGDDDQRRGSLVCGDPRRRSSSARSTAFALSSIARA